MSTIKYDHTNESLLFKDVLPNEMFYYESVFWTKHSFSIEGISGATALVGYLNPDTHTPSRVFSNDTKVFKITKTVI